MATIENLGAQLFRRIHQAAEAPSIREAKASTRHQAGPVPSRPEPSPVEAAIVKRTEEVQRRETSAAEVLTKAGRANEKVEHETRMSLDELSDMLQKVNLTFDLFEIQARFSVDRQTGDISVEVINQRTGEVIRKIPPYDIAEFVQSVVSPSTPHLDVGVEGSGEGGILTDIRV